MMTLTIGKLAKATGLSTETIRYYEREGLLPEPGRSAVGYRIYPESSVARLQFISRAKRLGFTLAEIKNLLWLSDGRGNLADVKQLTEDKLAMVEQRISDLARIRDALQELNTWCPEDGCVDYCPIIAALAGDTEIPIEETH